MSFDKGALVYVNYTAKVKDTGEAIESTVEDEAKKLSIYDSDRSYGPRLVAVGEGWVLKGLDDEISKLTVGERKTVELAPERAWGDRDPTLLRMMPIRKFGEKADELRVGDAVEVDNRVGIVRFIGSGRAQVDFNHRLAGKTLVYEVEVVGKVDSDEDKIRALIKRRFPGEVGEKMPFRKDTAEVTLDIPEAAFLAEGLQVIKRGAAADIVTFIPTVTKVTFREVYERKEPKAPKAETEEKTVEAAEAPPPTEEPVAET